MCIYACLGVRGKLWWGSELILGNKGVASSSGYVPQRLSPRPPWWQPLPLLLIISKLDGQAVSNAAEGGRLHFPVGHRVVEEADAIIVGPLDSEAHRTEVIDAHLGDVVGVQIDNLEELEIWEASRHPGQLVVVQVKFPQGRQKTQAPILNHPNLIVT